MAAHPRSLFRPRVQRGIPVVGTVMAMSVAPFVPRTMPLIVVIRSGSARWCSLPVTAGSRWRRAARRHRGGSSRGPGRASPVRGTDRAGERRGHDGVPAGAGTQAGGPAGGLRRHGRTRACRPPAAARHCRGRAGRRITVAAQAAQANATASRRGCRARRRARRSAAGLCCRRHHHRAGRLGVARHGIRQAVDRGGRTRLQRAAHAAPDTSLDVSEAGLGTVWAPGSLGHGADGVFGPVAAPVDSPGSSDRHGEVLRGSWCSAGCSLSRLQCCRRRQHLAAIQQRVEPISMMVERRPLKCGTCASAEAHEEKASAVTARLSWSMIQMDLPSSPRYWLPR